MCNVSDREWTKNNEPENGGIVHSDVKRVEITFSEFALEGYIS